MKTNRGGQRWKPHVLDTHEGFGLQLYVADAELGQPTWCWHCLWGWVVLTGISFQVKTVYDRRCIRVIILYKCNWFLCLLSFQKMVLYKAKLSALAWQDAFFQDSKRNGLETLPEISRYHHTMLVSFHWLPPSQATQFPGTSSLSPSICKLRMD